MVTRRWFLPSPTPTPNLPLYDQGERNVIKRLEMLVLGKFCMLYFSYKHRFEILPFAFLPTIIKYQFHNS